MAYNIFIFTILFAILESLKITLFKDLLGKIFEAKVAEIDFFSSFPRLWLRLIVK